VQIAKLLRTKAFSGVDFAAPLPARQYPSPAPRGSRIRLWRMQPHIAPQRRCARPPSRLLRWPRPLKRSIVACISWLPSGGVSMTNQCSQPLTLVPVTLSACWNTNASGMEGRSLR